MFRSRSTIGVTTLLLAVVLSGCVAESATTPSEAPTSATPTSSAAADPSPTPEASETTAGIALPDDCAQIYSPAMLSSLEQEGLPLNDPAVTMLATQNAALLGDLETLPTLRCSWGAPGSVGITTNVTVVDAPQAAAIETELAEGGFGCGDQGGGTVCSIEQRGVSLDDVPYVRGETHALRGNVWVATSWLNHPLDGYVEDILATLGA